MQQLKTAQIPRTPGTAVFLTRTPTDTPPVMAWQVKHNRALHERCLIIHVTTLSRPWLRDGERLTISEIAPDIWRGEARYGFMERPHIPALLKLCAPRGFAFDLDDVTYYVAHETVIHREDGLGMPLWQEMIFSLMERNTTHYAAFARLPNDCVVEIGRQIAI